MVAVNPEPQALARHWLDNSIGFSQLVNVIVELQHNSSLIRKHCRLPFPRSQPKKF